MKAFKFMKIDYIKTKQQVVFVPMLLVLVLGIMMLPDSEGTGFNVHAVMPFSYIIFMVTIFASGPFGMCRKEESGFLKLLPATTWERVAGRFLYGVSLMLAAAVMGFGAVVIRWLTGGFAFSATDLQMCLIVLAAGILIMTAEYVFFYLFGENASPNIIGVVRTIPGMCLFFSTSGIFKTVMKDPEKGVAAMQMVGSYLERIGWISMIAAMAVFIAATVFCARVADTRDF
ncbi:MAG: ABC-2 transporter permease [Eubacterium sp.]|nr:ABC-2 transporter permease [Eubacterium sp.]